MHILLNGERRELPGPRTVRILLEDLGIDARVVAVEVNRTVIRRERHDQTIVSDGAEVEIVSFVGGGAMTTRPGRTRRAIVLVAFAVCVSAPAGATRSVRQQDATQQPPVLTEETTTLASGWALLAAGDAAKAIGQAEAVLARYPRSVAAASLLVEAEIARGGGFAGLNAYERWLGGRRLEDGYLLRRAARAMLWQATTSPEVGVEALQYLAADDDAEARAQLVRRMVAGSMGDTRALARVGDEGAVRRLIDQIENSPGGKMFQIDALVQSRSPLAIPPLTKLLDDRNHPDHIAAAANGLGTLNARAAIPQLRRLYADTSLPSPVRFMAAAGLYKMNDMTGLPLLQMQLTSENANLRIGAARFMAGQPGGGQPDATWLTVVRGLVGDPDPAVRVQAAELVAAYDLDLARQSLEGLLTDENAAIRGLAGLAYIDRVATDFGTLRRFLRSPDGLTQVRAAGRVLELTR